MMHKHVIATLYALVFGAVMFFLDPVLSRWNETEPASLVTIAAFAVAGALAVYHPHRTALFFVACVGICCAIACTVETTHFWRRLTAVLISVAPLLVPSVWTFYRHGLSLRPPEEKTTQ